MTKDQLQQELKKEIKPGIKPSDLRRKLKKSKSDSDLPKNKTQALSHSRSHQEIPLAPPTSTIKIKELEDKVSVLELKLETSQRELGEKEETIQEKQQRIENLEKQLDNSLEIRHQTLKKLSAEQEKSKQLADDIDQVSDELVEKDKKISSLRGENSQLKLTNQSLQRDLKLATRLAEMRKVPYYSKDDNLTYWKYALYSLAMIGFTIWLLKSNN